ncbi:epoxide hydrolase [Diplodia corticola]|uniref:Epoxide hydrolase n=1 Tax=Diplodia corticola TaxID=236234 RepID=A0A1J9RYU2_9PEZI|nr:epoxide hydrolase [Diplodia corticola]OJD33519.1 epoxide hydrolase [Diplodia corticola]
MGEQTPANGSKPFFSPNRICDYSWRAEESHYNAALPQYRTAITVPSSGETLRVHFVHKQCQLGELTPRTYVAPGDADRVVVPLLFCHDVHASSFLDVSGVIDALTTMTGGGDGRDVAFHVVAPSVPGTGFSDASDEEGFGVGETAEVFDALMKRLGYGRYVSFGAGWGFTVCRALALRHGPDSCVAIHAANPASFFPPPSLRKSPLEWLRYRLARATGARVPGLSFGYVPADFDNDHDVFRPTTTNTTTGAGAGKTKVADEETAAASDIVHLKNERSGREEMGGETACGAAFRPQTLTYALCDSPVGLLANTLDVLRPCLTAGRRAGYMSAVWTPATLLNWTMMRWFPGPEAGFRWMQRARRDSEMGGFLWSERSNVPLGISQFGAQRGVGARWDGVLRWARAWQNVCWAKKREGSDVIRPEWESPEELVQDLRESFGAVWLDGGES